MSSEFNTKYQEELMQEIDITKRALVRSCDKIESLESHLSAAQAEIAELKVDNVKLKELNIIRRTFDQTYDALKDKIKELNSRNSDLILELKTAREEGISEGWR